MKRTASTLSAPPRGANGAAAAASAMAKLLTPGSASMAATVWFVSRRASAPRMAAAQVGEAAVGVGGRAGDDGEQQRPEAERRQEQREDGQDRDREGEPRQPRVAAEQVDDRRRGVGGQRRVGRLVGVIRPGGVTVGGAALTSPALTRPTSSPMRARRRERQRPDQPRARPDHAAQRRRGHRRLDQRAGHRVVDRHAAGERRAC